MAVKMESAVGVAVQEEGRHGHGINARVDNSLYLLWVDHFISMTTTPTDHIQFSKLVEKSWGLPPPFPTPMMHTFVWELANALKKF